MRAVLGLQGAQAGTNLGRGIERYILDHAAALVAAAGAELSLDIDPDQPPPRLPEPLAALAAPEASDPGVPAVYHAMSPFEEIPLRRVWPGWARSGRHALVTTLYDLIPLIYEDVYLVTPVLRWHYMRRLRILSVADMVLPISRGCADDAERLLGVPPERLHVIRAGCAPQFRPPDRPPAEIEQELTVSHPRLKPGYVLYLGAADHRKNVRGLIDGYAALPDQVRERHQLVLAGRLVYDEPRELREHARRSGAGGTIEILGQVPDPEAVALLQACGCFVTATLYEGFGLPVVEAVRCGAAALGSDIPSLREVLPDEARFDPRDRAALTAVLLRALSEPGFAAAIRAGSERLSRPFTWEAVAAETLAAYERALAART